MNHSCFSSVHGPAVVDCAIIQYPGFGEGTFNLYTGKTKYFSQGTGALTVSATQTNNTEQASNRCSLWDALRTLR